MSKDVVLLDGSVFPRKESVKPFGFNFERNFNGIPGAVRARPAPCPASPLGGPLGSARPCRPPRARGAAGLLGRAGERRDHRRGRQALQRVGMEGHHLRRRRVSMLAALNDLARRLAPHRLRASPPPPCARRTRPSRVC